MNISEKDIAKFWSHVDIRGGDECWEWDSHRNRDGYGIFSWNNRYSLAHRVSFFLQFGYLPEDAHHTCKNRACCNASHLQPLTHSEHAVLTGLERAPDTYHRGDDNFLHKHPERAARGERAGNVKITDVQVDEVRILKTKGMSHRAIGRLFGISQVQVGRIVRGESRKLKT